MKLTIFFTLIMLLLGVAFAFPPEGTIPAAETKAAEIQDVAVDTANHKSSEDSNSSEDEHKNCHKPNA
ncbi:AAEL014937-PA [Aedes aegypti]|uniref:AAEL014937-PA n=1 Tax=Aedes aegypti TaxID=7159 RepID=Q16F13_AEDAE|nr:AAEL014937-PA [Aedes aegypti]